MIRRSILGMFAAAPVAAAMPSPPISTTPSEANVLKSFIPSYFDDYTNGIDNDVARLNVMKWRIDNGHWRDGTTAYQPECPNINSRRATSSVAREWLQAEYRKRKALERAQDNISRKVLARMMPRELQPFFSPSLDS